MGDVDDIERKIGLLIGEHFRDGRLSLPSGADEQRREVIGWLSQKTLRFRAAALALLARVRPILEGLRGDLFDYERERFFFRIDSRHIVKSPEGILEKMARKWGAESNPPISFHNLGELTDLGRFRVVVNFLSDLETISRHLEAPYDGSARDELTEPQRKLFDDFFLRSNRFENLVELSPSERKKGERCLKGVFLLKSDPSVCIEVQLMTALQEAWDKKDHFLIYEQRRRGNVVLDAHEREIFSISESLFLMDLHFDRMKRDIELQLPEVRMEVGEGS